MKQQIQFVKREEAVTNFCKTHPELFTYTPKAGWRWVQRLCLWVMGKIGAQWVEHMQKVDVHRVVVDSDKVVDAVYEQYGEIMACNHHAPSKIYMGSEDFHSLMGETGPDYLWGFQAEYVVDRKLMGMEVVVVPWMKGVLIVP